ncbi:WD40 repeat domain-containing serine/threonine protein kinase [Pseudoxanthomonas daejeonensis]|nr:WD40 repeat domain-containing serine/threonine protein kinase [Pseudoxanthomonas daejeonensis]
MNPGDEMQDPGHREAMAALASLAFGHSRRIRATEAGVTRHLAFLSIEALELDLSDPEQRAFGDYELLEEIGAGGMGVVYRARQKSLDREVAIKLLSAGPWASRDFIARFQREAQSAARLQHPNIVAIHEIGIHDELNYFSMALFTGPSLAQLLARRGPLPPREAARMVRTIAEALHYAHRLGVLHLDLKPGNVLTDANGEPHVADFGLARRIDSTLATDGNEISGTPSYMAPEQVELRRHRLSVATDIYGLGAIFYELLTGHPPYSAATPRETLDQVLHGRLARPGSHRQDIPADLEEICLKCLAREPSERYADARLLADDLGRFLEDRPVSVRPLGRWQRLWRWMHREPAIAATSALATFALLAGLVASTWQWQRAESSAASARGHLWAQRHETAWRHFEEQRGFAALPLLATNLAEQRAHGAAAAEATERLRLRVAQAQVPALLEAIDVGAAVHVLALSPDGRYLALGLEPNTVALYEVASLRQLWRVELALHEPSTDGQLRRLHFTPDMRHLLVSEHWSMLQIRPSGFQGYRLALADGKQTQVPGGDTVRSESWSDDGRHVVLTDLGQRWFRLYDASTWQPLGPAMDAPLAGFRPGWLIAPGLVFIAMHRGDGSIGVLDPSTLQPRHVVPAAESGARYTAWAISPDARWLALGRADGETLLVDAGNGSTRTLFPPTGGEATWLEFSGDGRHLAATVGSEFFVFGIPDGAGMYYMARDPAVLWGHQFECETGSDDCRALLMESDRVTLWSMSGGYRFGDAPLMESPEITHHSFVPRFASRFDPARQLLATGAQDGSLRLWRLPAAPLRPHLGPTQREATLHFDGRHLVAVDGHDTWIFDAQSGQALSPRMRLPQPVGFAALAADGRTLVASSGRELHVFDWRNGALRYPPIMLGGSPMDLWLASDGGSVVSRWASPQTRPPGLQRVQAHDLASGQPLGPAGDLLLDSAHLTADNRHLLVSVADATHLYALADLRQPLRSFPIPDYGWQVASGIEDRVHGELVQMLERVESGVDNALRRWSLADGRLLGEEPLKLRADDLLARVQDGRIAISGNPGGTSTSNRSLMIDRDGKRLPMTQPRLGHLARAQAFSADGRVLAQALADGVMLFDADTGAPLGPALRAQVRIPDAVAQLAFSPDARALVARTALGRWLVWSLAPEAREPALVAEEAALLAPVPGDEFRLPSPALRASFLQRDDTSAVGGPRPGPWSCLAAPGTLPPRAADTPARLLDLGSRYTASLHELQRSSWGSRPKGLGNLCAVPLGVQRLQGVDYDLRGVVDLRASANDRNAPAQGRSDSTGPLPVQPGRYAAAHVLGAQVGAPAAGTGDDPAARLRFSYSDGSQAEVPLRLGTIGGGHAGWIDQPSMSMPWSGSLPELEVSYNAQMQLYGTRIDNPHPTRELAAIEVRATSPLAGDRPVVIAAITLDPLADAAPSSRPGQRE